jgi:hypothetical protein
MDEEEIVRRLTKLDQLMNQLIFAFMQRGMSYRQAEEEMFQEAKEKEILQGNGRRLRIGSQILPWRLRCRGGRASALVLHASSGTMSVAEKRTYREVRRSYRAHLARRKR